MTCGFEKVIEGCMSATGSNCSSDIQQYASVVLFTKQNAGLGVCHRAIISCNSFRQLPLHLLEKAMFE
jgi:hypothetical protein